MKRRGRRSILKAEVVGIYDIDTALEPFYRTMSASHTHHSVELPPRRSTVEKAALFRVVDVEVFDMSLTSGRRVRRRTWLEN